MSRSRDSSDASPAIPGGGSREPDRFRDRDHCDRSPDPNLSREPVRRDALSELSESERRTLVEIGRFRAVDARDLGLSSGRLRELERQGLLRLRSIKREGSRPLRAATLTNRSRCLLEKNFADLKGGLRSGFVQSRQLKHDAALYRLYRLYEERIRRQGGRVRRVLPDHEIKRRVFSDFNRPQDPRRSAEEHRREIAQRHHLKVVDGKIPIPDLRVEYEASDGREARVDLELVTDHYRPAQLAEKAQAGFALYGLGPAGSGEGASVREERDRIAEIVSI